MLPVINLTRDCVTKQHLADVRRYIRELMPLQRVEREFVTIDAMWVRGAVFRLRPILMTTAAMVFGVLPLVIASGAGAAGRYAMGLVIFTGMSIGTMFTLFVVPAMYMFLAGEHQPDSVRAEPSATPALSG